MKKTLLLAVSFVLSIAMSFAQTSGVSINENGASPDPSAILDVSSSTKGALIPRMTTGERNAIENPANGLQIYNTTTNCINLWTGSTWKQSCFECDFPSPVASNSGPICEGNTLNLTSASIPGAVYQWSGPNGFTSTDQNPTIPNASSAASGSYSVIATLNGCTSQPQTTVATVNDIPVTPTATSDSPACVGESLNIFAETVSGATYQWSGPNGFTSNVQNPNFPSAQQSHAGMYTVVATVNGCESPSSSTTITILNNPVSTFSNTSANTLEPTIFTPTLAGAAYNWTFENGNPATSTDENPSVSWSVSGNNDVTLTVTSGGCSSSTTVGVSVFQITVQTFTSSTQWTVPSGVTSVEYLVVGGGGGGGDGNAGGGAGGAGGFVEGTMSVTPGNSISVVVGSGGSGGCCNANGQPGGNSSFGTVVAFGGGRGGGCDVATGGSGGSGGGGAGPCFSGQGGSSTQTSPPGGIGYGNPGSAAGNQGGGGGGAGSAGSLPNGGSGRASSITGSVVYYAGGGGGGGYSGPAGTGGIGGGGNGGKYPDGINGSHGVANTGGGGGGAADTQGGNGGSGVVIIRY